MIGILEKFLAGKLSIFPLSFGLGLVLTEPEETNSILMLNDSKIIVHKLYWQLNGHA